MTYLNLKKINKHIKSFAKNNDDSFFFKSATANPYEIYHTHPQQDMTMMSSNITYPSSCPMELHLPPQGAACPLTNENMFSNPPPSYDSFMES